MDIFYCASGTVKAIPAGPQPMTASRGGGNWPRVGKFRSPPAVTQFSIRARLFRRITHVCLAASAELLRRNRHYSSEIIFDDQLRKGNKVMPVLLWVAFWSSLMGSAACFGETPRPARSAIPKRRDLSPDDVSSRD